MNATPDPLTDALLEALPANLQQVLEIGASSDALAARYTELWPGAGWTSLERLDRSDAALASRRFDAVVLGSGAPQWREGSDFAGLLHEVTRPQAQLFTCLPSMGHHAVVQRFLMGDLSDDAAGPMDLHHSRLFSPASTFKQLLDGGWLPQLKAQLCSEVPDSVFTARLVAAAMALGLPRQTALRNLGLQYMVLQCERQPVVAPKADARFAPFSVIVPVNRPLELELNIARSPGLREVGAEVITIEGAASAADAFERGAAQARHDWRLFVHQDVYFPLGSGLAIAQQLAEMEDDGRAAAPVGFAGLEAAADLRSGLRYAGQVIDRTQRFDHAGSNGGVSIDEFAVALHRSSPVVLDAQFGWHLWATDLCLQALGLGGAPCAQILRVPLFHNSTTGYTLPGEFHESAQRLLDKHGAFDEIPTLCGAIRRHGEQRAAA